MRSFVAEKHYLPLLLVSDLYILLLTYLLILRESENAIEVRSWFKNFNALFAFLMIQSWNTVIWYLVFCVFMILELVAAVFWSWSWSWFSINVKLTNFYEECAKKHSMSQQQTLMVIKFGEQLRPKKEVIKLKVNTFGWMTPVILSLPLLLSFLLNLGVIFYLVQMSAKSSYEMKYVKPILMAGVLVPRGFDLLTVAEFWGSVYEKHLIKYWPQDCYYNPTTIKDQEICEGAKTATEDPMMENDQEKYEEGNEEKNGNECGETSAPVVDQANHLNSKPNDQVAEAVISKSNNNAILQLRKPTYDYGSGSGLDNASAIVLHQLQLLEYYGERSR